MKTELFPFTPDEFHHQNNSILLLGLGNYLMGDEGVGVHYIHSIIENNSFQNITVIDGGTGGFLLVPYLESHKIAIIVDATMDGKEEGTISLLKPKFSNDFPVSLSGHNFGLKDMVEILTLFDRMPEIFLYTISIKEMKPMVTELSPKVQAAIDPLHLEIFNLLETINLKKEKLIEQ